MANGLHRSRNAWYRSSIVAVLFAVAMLAPSLTFAQDTAGDSVKSKTRDELNAELQAAFAETDEPIGNPDGTYVVGATSDLQTMNPFLAESDPSVTVNALVYEALIGGDPRTGEPAPGGLTDYWERSADGLTYTFHLSQTATWHDGVDVTADDVVFSMDALADPETGSAYTGSFVSTVASWTALDADTVQITAVENRFTTLYDLGGLSILPKHIWESVPHTDWATDPGSTGQDASRVIGSGPFKFVSWQQGQEIRLTRNDAFHDTLPGIKDYVFRIYPDDDASLNAFLDGDIDFIELSPEQVALVDGNDQYGWTSYPERGFTYYEFNLNPDTTTLFQDQRVRQAMMFALDRESIVNDIMLGFAEVANGTHPSISPAYSPDQMRTVFNYDVEKAKSLLAEAGWTDTDGDGYVDKDGQNFSFEFLYPAGSATNDSIVAYLQDAWRAVGLDMEPSGMDFSALIEATTTNPTFEVAMYGFGWDASFVQDAMFACDQYQVGFNDMKYCNPALDEIFAQIRVEFDPVKRRDLMIEAANIVNDEQPVAVLQFSVGIDAWSSRVHNSRPTAWGNQSFTGIWVDD